MAMPCGVQSCRQRRMDAGDIGPLVVALANHLSALGHTRLTVTGYEASARHFAHWLMRSRIEVGDVDDDVIQRFARHRCRCPGTRRQDRLSAKYVNRTRRFVEFLGGTRNRPAQGHQHGSCDRPTCGRVPGLAAAASRHHRARR